MYDGIKGCSGLLLVSFAWFSDQIHLRSLEISGFVKFRYDYFVGFLKVTSCVYGIIFFLLSYKFGKPFLQSYKWPCI